PTEDLDHPFNLGSTSDGGIELPLPRQVGEVSAEVVEGRCLRLLLTLSGCGRRCGTSADPCRFTRSLLTASPCSAHLGTEHLESLRPGLVEADPERGENLGRNPLFLTEETEKKVFGAHIGVIEFPGLGHRELKN